MKLKTVFCLLLYAFLVYLFAVGFLLLFASLILPNMPSMVEWLFNYYAEQGITGFSRDFGVLAFVTAVMVSMVWLLVLAIDSANYVVNLLFGKAWVRDFSKFLKRLARKSKEWLNVKAKY